MPSFGLSTYYASKEAFLTLTMCFNNDMIVFFVEGFLIVERLSERFRGNTSVDDTSMKFSPYVLYMTHIKF